ncbi:hypothetical protein BROC_02198 [Candidatus Brocadiaceae bacterium]|nr:hypothetical protein BROC_02198 [Candidatus Brocadiaceae bacterium]
MNGYKRAARLVGILYIIGTVAGILSYAFVLPILDNDDYLTEISTHENQMVMGSLLVMTMGLALAMIPAVMFPILKKQHETLAVGYVIFRGALETVSYLLLITFWLLLITVGREYADAAPSDVASLASLGVILKDGSDLVGQITPIVFTIGAMMFYTMLYSTRLVPRWLSGWGIIGDIPYFAVPLLVLFGVFEANSASATLLQMPLALQEMVLAVWLIVRGFNPSAIAAATTEG